MFFSFFPRKHFLTLQENVAFQVPLPPAATPRPSGHFTGTCSSSLNFPSWDFLPSFSFKQGSSHTMPRAPRPGCADSQSSLQDKSCLPKPPLMQKATKPGTAAEIDPSHAQSTVDTEPPSSCPREVAALLNWVKTFTEVKKKNHENPLNH